MKGKFLVSVSLLVAAFTSCKKDDGFDNSLAAPIYGEWKFIGLSANTLADVTISGSGLNERSVTTSSYTAINPKGTMKIDEVNIVTSDVEYAINGKMTVRDYTTSPYDEYEMPFVTTVPKSSGTAAYQAVGADSLYIATGGVIKIEDGADMPATSMPAVAGGYRYKLAGNKLTLFMKGGYNQNISAQGMTVKYLANVDSQLLFEKQ